ncbi:UDP-glucose 4-epimerase GalE [Azomonas macrocytogenes]|uniref:UDP-glucose 4-epimerase n=1 Tax=Azomonas macrocytogenes TaxID=69962 RepID=A0A839T3A4_AZOMA|nr:UDP-glucose 4-epimerase GalE [Azomonas macrocytogenes]MBB3102445.1 UDP-glucose 4-epimerase [Azomonas macrocytogenes]
MILVTGGAGYIGTHAVLALMQSGHDVLVLDNLCNSTRSALDRVASLAGRRPRFVLGDIRNRALLDSVFAQFPIEAVMHFAGLKAVGESVREPLRYYDTNVGGSVNLCQAMAQAGVFRLVFSSSATVYGQSKKMPINEHCALGQPTNPYGQSKLMAEHVMHSVAESDPRWAIGLLRYFNPIGAHASGLLGEAPKSVPNNLLPYLLQVATGQRPSLPVYGTDYPTPDGTAVRDYIHVVDLAGAHLKALDYLMNHTGISVWNVGTGLGYSVLELVHAFEHVSKVKISLSFEPRRPGDIAQCWSDPTRARQQLDWVATRDLNCMLEDAWRWQCRNPEGYVLDTLELKIKLADKGHFYKSSAFKRAVGSALFR